MKTIEQVLRDVIENKSLVSGQFTSARLPAQGNLRRVEMKLVSIKSKDYIQFAYHEKAKVTHRNLPPQDAISEAMCIINETFSQCMLRTIDSNIQVRARSNCVPDIKITPAARPAPKPTHDRPKHRLLPEGAPVEFLVRLGVMSSDGRVLAAKFDKYRQINRFLEIAADAASSLRQEGPLTIVDFGSGKSYLTFALYHYFHEMLKRDVTIVGLDLKQDVVDHCSAIARDLNFSGLTFAVGDIAGYSAAGDVDMVVSLHACDTATDAALQRAVALNARVILAVPCCQHELFGQIRSEVNRPLLRHGILRERLAALITDALRAGWLESNGYSVQVMEFIETAHTPKNLLLRAVKGKHSSNVRPAIEEYEAFRDYWAARPSIDKL